MAQVLNISKSTGNFCGTLKYKAPLSNLNEPPSTPKPSQSPKSWELAPMVGVEVSSKILNFTSQIQVLQRFTNKESNPIEAIYDFALQESAAVTQFWAQVEDKRIVGELKEKNEAKDKYDDAISGGHGAYLMEKHEVIPNLFSVNVGNLPPGKDILIGIIYVNELSFDKDNLIFRLPVDEQFAPQTFGHGSQDETLEKQVRFGLNCKIDLDFTFSDIKTIKSPSHPIEFKFGDSQSRATVNLTADPSQPFRKDFELQIALKTPHQSTALIEESEKDPKSKAALFCVYPDLDEDKDDVNAEIIFLVDQSGSMGSEGRMEAVKDTLDIFLRSLPESVSFNIYGFGNTFYRLFSDSLSFNQESLQKALDHVAQMTSNLGGTDILNPLRSIFKEPHTEGVPKVIFLLTDGQVSNRSSIIQEVKKNALHTRVFSFGMGSGADKQLVQGVGTAGNGGFSFIQKGDYVDSIVLTSLTAALKPTLVDLKLELDPPLPTSPSRLSPRLAGTSILIYAFLKQDIDTLKIKLTGKCGKRDFVYEAVARVSAKSVGDLIHSLAAQSFIQQYENRTSHFHSVQGDLIDVQQSAVDSEIIALSLKHHILCTKTAFVAIERRKEATQGTLEVKIVSAERPSNIETEEEEMRRRMEKEEMRRRMEEEERRRVEEMQRRSTYTPTEYLQREEVERMNQKQEMLRRMEEEEMKRRGMMVEQQLMEKESRQREENTQIGLLEIEIEEKKKEEMRRIMEEEQKRIAQESEQRKRQEETAKMNHEKQRIEMERFEREKRQKEAEVKTKEEVALPQNRVNPEQHGTTSSKEGQLRQLLICSDAKGVFKVEALKLLSWPIHLQDFQTIHSDHQLLTTVIVVLYLESQCQSQKTVWGLIAKKARKYVSAQSPDRDLFELVKEKISVHLK